MGEGKMNEREWLEYTGFNLDRDFALSDVVEIMQGWGAVTHTDLTEKLAKAVEESERLRASIKNSAMRLDLYGNDREDRTDVIDTLLALATTADGAEGDKG